MSFRVLVSGGRRFTDYRLLRATLDALLAHRLPDVELLTAGGPGVPLLAASYAAERGLTVRALVPDFRRFPVDAADRRDAFLAAEADAAVVVWEDRAAAVRRVLALVERRGIPVHVIGGPPKPRGRRVPDPEPPPPRGLPD
jgi:ABC-type sugar transport system substrate-binding protein